MPMQYIVNAFEREHFLLALKEKPQLTLANTAIVLQKQISFPTEPQASLVSCQDTADN